MVYCVNMNVDIKNNVKQCVSCLDYQHTQPHESTISYDLLCRPWEVVDADTFSINNNMLLCIVDYYSKFFIMKKGNGLSDSDPIRAAKIVFTKFDYQRNSFRCMHESHIRPI